MVRVIAVKITVNMRTSRNQIEEDHLSASDHILMERLRLGETAALGEIYVRYAAMVKSAIYRVSPNVIAADVDELTQDIFIALFHSAKQFDHTKRLKPWLYGIAVNKAADNRRRGGLHRRLLQKHSETESLKAPAQINPLDEKMHLQNQLEKAFETLPKEQHDVMILHAVEGFKGHEIANILGIEINTVWTRLHRARKTLLSRLTAAAAGNE